MNEYEAEAGEYFMYFIERVKSSLKQRGSLYGHAKFNGYRITISHDSNIDDICRIYDLTREIDRLKNK